MCGYTPEVTDKKGTEVGLKQTVLTVIAIECSEGLPTLLIYECMPEDSQHHPPYTKHPVASEPYLKFEDSKDALRISVPLRPKEYMIQ